MRKLQKEGKSQEVTLGCRATMEIVGSVGEGKRKKIPTGGGGVQRVERRVRSLTSLLEQEPRYCVESIRQRRKHII
jgi:hypothetical protein